jgi:activating signal cointegrator complex subunit 3
MYYLRNETVSLFSKHIPGNGLSIFELAKFLADSSEYDEFPMRHKDDIYNAQLAQDLPFNILGGNMESPHMKGLLVQLMHMFHVLPPIQDYYTDLKSFLDQSVRIIQGMLEISMTASNRSGSLRTVLNLLILNQLLVVGTHPWDNILEFMITREKMNSLPKSISSLHALVEYVNGPTRVSGLDSEVFNMAKKIPCARFYVNFNREKDSLDVNVTHLNNPDEFAVIPLSMVDSQASGGKRRKLAWWIVIGSEITGQVIAARRISIPSTGNKSISFPLEEFRSPSVTVYLVSDCYFGIDQEISLEVL